MSDVITRPPDGKGRTSYGRPEAKITFRLAAKAPEQKFIYSFLQCAFGMRRNDVIQKARLAKTSAGVVVFEGSEKAAKAKMDTARKMKQRMYEKKILNTSGLEIRKSKP